MKNDCSLFFYCSYALVHCPGAGLKKKKKKAQNVQTYQNVDVNVDPNPHLVIKKCNKKRNLLGIDRQII